MGRKYVITALSSLFNTTMGYRCIPWRGSLGVAPFDVADILF